MIKAYSCFEQSRLRMFREPSGAAKHSVGVGILHRSA
jgi:hypothetical protein